MPPKRSARSASRESTPAPIRRSARNASREPTPTPQPTATSAENRRVTRSHSPIKNNAQLSLPKVILAGSNSYGSEGRNGSADPIAQELTANGFEADLEGNVRAVRDDEIESLANSEADDTVNVGQNRQVRLPPPIIEEEEEEDGENNAKSDQSDDEDDEEQSSSAFRRSILQQIGTMQTPSEISRVYQREGMLAPQAKLQRAGSKEAEEQAIPSSPLPNARPGRRQALRRVHRNRPLQSPEGPSPASQLQPSERAPPLPPVPLFRSAQTMRHMQTFQTAEAAQKAQTIQQTQKAQVAEKKQSFQRGQQGPSAQQNDSTLSTRLIFTPTRFMDNMKAVRNMKYGYIIVVLLLALIIPLFFSSACTSSENPLCLHGLGGFSFFESVKDTASNAWSKLPFVRIAGGSQNFTGDVYQRMSSVESSVKGLNKAIHIHDLSRRKLESILPDVLVVPKSRKGHLEIPPQFWQALKDKIEYDFGDKLNAPVWETFMAKNEIQLNELLNNRIDDEVKKAIMMERVISKEAFTKLLEENFASHIETIERQKDLIKDQFKHTITELETMALSKAERIFEEQIRRMPALQLSSIASANLLRNVDVAIRTVNFFSPRQGAVIDPYLTSPTARRPNSISFFNPKRLYQRFLGITDTNPPISAISSWQEAGDCWCAASMVDDIDIPPQKQPQTGRSQLSVLMAHTIFPTQVTVEHIPKEGTLDITAAPKELEIWVEIKDSAARARIAEIDKILTDRRLIALHANDISGAKVESMDVMTATPEDMPPTFVRIGYFQYGVHKINHVQTFELDIQLEDYGIGINRAVVRVLGNHGRAYTCIYRVRMHGVVLPTSNPA